MRKSHETHDIDLHLVFALLLYHPPIPDGENDPMAKVQNVNSVFYPAFCFKASPTHFTWVKMAAVDVHRLQKVKGFEGMHLMLYVHSLSYSLVVVEPNGRDSPACVCLRQNPLSCQTVASG